MDFYEEYLEPSFRSENLTINRLKEILRQHNVKFRPSSKKAELLQLFEEKIRNNFENPQILTEDWAVRRGNQTPDNNARSRPTRQVFNNRLQQHSPKTVARTSLENHFILESSSIGDDDGDETIVSNLSYQEQIPSKKINGSSITNESSSPPSFIKVNEQSTTIIQEDSLQLSPPPIHGNEPPLSFSIPPDTPTTASSSSQVINRNIFSESRYDIPKYCWFGTEINKNHYNKRTNRIPSRKVLRESERAQRNKVIKNIFLVIFMMLLIYHRIKNYAGYYFLKNHACTPCPDSSNCIHGKIESCADGYRLLKSDFSIYDMTSTYCEAEMGVEEKIKYYSEALKKAAVLQHENLVCSNESGETTSLKNLKSKIKYKDSDEEPEKLVECGFEELNSDPDLKIESTNKPHNQAVIILFP
ncbi:427_t:CDS:2 [Entrophospora sp. SA101]|nr:10414_t:CDS:2 [Entrophospora sp. SA101]CAJ0634348.1 10417_t:CDS:2 [Entrophospora sp. SA101]CAJ0761840.1 17553_t:CDS:2 [Entrophospora sp. SA101]CAJ0766081.1 427_t:CDS:2 [Entrophospora sp. SA101]CAJ0880221.1 14512_t:CDS:2 [Entrophospora sp. SA101]